MRSASQLLKSTNIVTLRSFFDTSSTMSSIVNFFRGNTSESEKSSASECPMNLKNKESSKSASKYFGDLGNAHHNALGGDAGVKKLAKLFYTKVFQDPILAPMFQVHSDDHPQRLYWFLLFFMEVSNIYFEKRGGFRTMHIMHQKSKHLPEREEAPPGCGCPGKGFTFSQKDAWKNHFVTSCKELGMEGGLLKDMHDWVDRMMGLYGPFVGDRKD